MSEVFSYLQDLGQKDPDLLYAIVLVFAVLINVIGCGTILAFASYCDSRANDERGDA